MSLFVHKQGESSNPALVLLHSGGMTHQEWQPQLSQFSEKFYVLAMDLPGHGQSRLREDEPVSIAYFSEQVVAWLNSENLSKVSIVGSSTGGAIAMYIAIHYPDLLEKLVLYRVGYQKDPQAFEETKRIASPEYWESYGMARWMSKQHLGQHDGLATEPEAADMWKSVIARVAQLFDPETTDHAHSLADLGKITCETMIIAGDRDPLVPVNTVVDMANAIPDAAIWLLPNASHVTATNTWRAKSFAEEVSRFIEK